MMKQILCALLAVWLMSSQIAEAAKFRNVEDKCVVKQKGEWYVLKTRFVDFDEYPQLQQRLTKQLFGKEYSSIRQAFHDYTNGFDAVKSFQYCNKAKGKEIRVEMVMTLAIKSRFLSFMTYRDIIDGKGQKKSEERGLIYDIQSERVLEADDILASPYLEKYKMEAGGAELQFVLFKDELLVGIPQNDILKSHSIFMFEGETIFADTFKKLIGYRFLKEEAQKRDSVKLKTQEEISLQEVDEQKVYDQVEQMPSFPGGTIKMREFVNDHQMDEVHFYSKTIKDGHVAVEFVVEKDGSLSHIKVIKSVIPTFDRDAVRIIEKMPRWSPGLQKGQPVRVRQVVDIFYYVSQ